MMIGRHQNKINQSLFINIQMQKIHQANKDMYEIMIKYPSMKNTDNVN